MSCVLLHLPTTEAGARMDNAGATTASLTLPHAAAAVDGSADLVLLLLALGTHFLHFLCSEWRLDACTLLASLQQSFRADYSARAEGAMD